MIKDITISPRHIGYWAAAGACAVLLCAFAWDAVSYAFRVSNSPYPILGHLIVFVKAAIALCMAILVARLAKRARKWIASEKTIAVLGVAVYIAFAVSGLLLRLLVGWSQLSDSMLISLEHQLADLMTLSAADRPTDNHYLRYLSMFPTNYGYANVLSIFYRLFAQSPAVAIVVQAVIAVLSAEMARKVSLHFLGKGGALCVFGLLCLLPSQIAQSAQLSATPLVALLLLTCAYAGMRLHTATLDAEAIRFPVLTLVLTLLSGVLAGYLAYCSLLGFGALAAILAVSLHRERKEIAIDHGAAMLMLVRRVLPAILMAIAFVLANIILHQSVVDMTQRSAPSAAQSMGYSLMIGSNVKSDGFWNPEDSSFFQTHADAEGAIEAHARAAQVAASRMRQDRSAMFSLASKRLSYLWQRDSLTVEVIAEQKQAQGEAFSGVLRYVAAASRNQSVYIALLLLSIFGIFRIPCAKQTLLLPVLYMLLSCIGIMVLLEPLSAYHDATMVLLIPLALLPFGTSGSLPSYRGQKRLVEKKENEQPAVHIIPMLREGHLVISVTKHVAEQAALQSEDAGLSYAEAMEHLSLVHPSELGDVEDEPL